MEKIVDNIKQQSNLNIGIAHTENQLKSWTIPLQIDGKEVNAPIWYNRNMVPIR